PGFRLLDAAAAVGGGDVVIGHGQGRLGPVHLAPGQAQTLEGLRARHLMDQMAVDIEQADAVVLAMGQVALPDLVEQRTRPASSHRGYSFSTAAVSASALTTRPTFSAMRADLPRRPRR